MVTASSDKNDEPPAEPTKDNGLFAPDDYEEVNERYFAGILKSQSWSAMPAGWHNPHSDGADMFEARVPDRQSLERYSLDEGCSLGDLKRSILNLVGAWECRAIKYDELTLSPSVSTANLLVLFALKTAGFTTIVFETPTYFAVLRQATLLGFAVVRVPCFRDRLFDAGLTAFRAAILQHDRAVLWITQPRFGIGTDQSLERLTSLGQILGPSRCLVIDEAAEQRFPSVIAGLPQMACPMLRTRGLFKGVGLNGLRLSFVLHPSEWRPIFEDILEAAGASMDRFSLTNAASVAEQPILFRAMLAQANAQVCRQRQMLEIMSIGSWMEPTPLENSYIGSLLLDLSYLTGSYKSKRRALLSYCRERRMPVVLSASIGFATDERWEAVRINYFTPQENVERAARILVDAQTHLG